MEEKLFKSGYKKILAIDEVGRGSLAGPFYVGGLFFTSKDYNNLKKIPITDSKKLSPQKRKYVFNLLNKANFKYKIEKFSNSQVDKLGIGYCFIKAVTNLYSFFKPNLVLVDGKEIRQLKKTIKNIKFVIRGDSYLISLGAISIICKVLRDNYMIKLSKKINLYNFDKNKGYGTFSHFEKIKKYGLSKYHRKTFLEL